MPLYNETEKRSLLEIDRDESGLPLLGVGPGVGLEFWNAYIPYAEREIRIATAYFRLEGYKLCRHIVPSHARIRVLVGRYEGFRVQTTILEHVLEDTVSEILQDLGRIDISLADAIQEMWERLSDGRLTIGDARESRTPFHCKFYIRDLNLMWQGSANFTRPGMTINSEQLSLITNHRQIAMLVGWFDREAKKALDLSKQVKDELRAWLDMDSPWHVYLKALSSWYTPARNDRGSDATVPTYYQEMLAFRAMNQLALFSGALLVVATGLGKTIIGAEIFASARRNGTARHLLVLTPKGVRRDWMRELEARDLNVRLFNTLTAFQPDSDDEYSQAGALQKELEQAGKETLIIIDEAHVYGGQLLAEAKHQFNHVGSRVFARFETALKRGAQVVLLTATVYGTTIQDLNSLLRLLPAKSQAAHDGIWSLKRLEELRTLAPISVLSIAQLLRTARAHGHIDEAKRPFLIRADGRRYLPKALISYAVRYEPFHTDEVEIAFDDDHFAHDNDLLHTRFDEETLEPRLGRSNAAHNSAAEGWISSPAAFAFSIRRNLGALEQASETREDESKPSRSKQRQSAAMRRPMEVREPTLQRLLTICETATALTDNKFRHLREILLERAKAGAKSIVFVNRRLTGPYLQRELSRIDGELLRVGCTISTPVNKEDEAPLLSNKERESVLKKFAPYSYQPYRTWKQSHDVGEDYHQLPEDSFNVLICTDADGVGVNLQDADTVIHYDLPQSAADLFQRVGRILRPTESPDRILHVYTFLPQFNNRTEEPGVLDAEDYAKSHSKIPRASIRKKITDWVDRVTRRHDKARAVFGYGSIASPEGPSQVEIPLEIGDTAQLIGVDAVLGDSSPGDTWIGHAGIAIEQCTEIAKLPTNRPLISACYSGNRRRIVILLRHKGEYHAASYWDSLHQEQRRQEQISVLDALDIFQSDKDTPKAAVTASTVDEAANIAANLWCVEKKIDPLEVEKICVLYLTPRGAQHTVTKEAKRFINELKNQLKEVNERRQIEGRARRQMVTQENSTDVEETGPA